MRDRSKGNAFSNVKKKTWSQWSMATMERIVLD